MCNLHWCYTFCTAVTLFALVLHLNCTALSQSESSNFFMCIITQEKSCDYLLIIYMKNFEMVTQKKRTRITQSGKNYAINCAIQGVRLIWKQKIWLAICKFLRSLTNQNAWFVSSFCTELTLFCTVFEKNCTALNQSKWRDFFMYIIREHNAEYKLFLMFLWVKRYQKLL